MSYRDFCTVRRSIYALLAIFFYSPAIWAQATPTYPSYVADAQIPIVSSDGFSDPQGIAVAPGGIVYVADSGNHRVIKIAPDGTQTTVSFGSLSPALDTPGAIALDGSGNLYVMDTGTTTRLIEVPGNGSAAKTLLSSPWVYAPIALASDSQGNLAFLNQGNADIFSLPAGGKPGFYNNAGVGGAIGAYDSPRSVAFDQQGQLYFTEGGAGATHVFRLPVGADHPTDITPPAPYLLVAAQVTVDAANDVILLNPMNGETSLIEIPASGGSPFFLPQTNLSNFSQPSGLAVDNLGNVYVADSSSSPNSVTKYVVHNAANFGSVPLGKTSAPIAINFAFFETTRVEQTLGFGGGAQGAEYHLVPGGTCRLQTYNPTVYYAGLPDEYAAPATCQVQFTFTPTYVGGRPGAVQLKTSTGTDTQLTFGTGLGGQLALMNAAISTKFSNINGVLVNAADTEIYYSGSGGTYRIPVNGGQGTLVAPGYYGPFAVNGAGDLFYADLYVPGGPGTITKVPADGSAPTTIAVAGLTTPEGIAMDYNGAFYIPDFGPDPEYDPSGDVIRVSSTGTVSQVLPGAWATPGLIAADLSGDIWVSDIDTQYAPLIQVGDGSNAEIGGLDVGGLNGAIPQFGAIDESRTIYYWEFDDDYGIEDLQYVSTTAEGCAWINCQVPLYRSPTVVNQYGGFTPFLAQNITTAPNGKMYVGDALSSGTFLVNRNQGFVPAAVFNPNNFIFADPHGGATQTEYVYNIGNRNVTFTDSSRILTESGSGVGSFTYGVPGGEVAPPACVPGGVIAPGNYCAFTVTSLNKAGSAATVTDTVHFLTDAYNNSQVSFEINGAGPPK